MLNKFCSRSTHIDDLKINTLRCLFFEDLGSAYESFANIFDDIDKFMIVGKFNNSKNQSKQINKTIGFIYTNIMKFKQNKHVKDGIFSDNFIDKVGCLIFSKNVIYHLNITGKTIGYARSFCNQKVTKNRKNRSALLLTSYLVLTFFSI